MNWYVYANNNPLNRVDPTGLNDFGIIFDPIKSILDGMRQTGNVITNEVNRILNSNQKYAVSGKTNLGTQDGSPVSKQFQNLTVKTEFTSEGVNTKVQPGISIPTPIVNISLKQNMYIMKNGKPTLEKGDSEFGIDLNLLNLGKKGKVQLQGRVNLNTGDISLGESISYAKGKSSFTAEVQHNISKTIKDLSALSNTFENTRILPVPEDKEKK